MTSAPSSPHVVLVVEDNPITLKMLRITLETEGYEVLAAAGGTEALEAAARRPPDLVLQDVILPDMDGFELVRELRSLHGAKIPILALSGYLGRLDESRAAAAGFTAVLEKPVEPARLVDIVRGYLPRSPRAEAGTVADPKLRPADDDPSQRELAALQTAPTGGLAHAHAVIEQLERRLEAHADLTRRCALQAAELSVLSGLADALAQRSDVAQAIGDVLDATLDAAGISKGAIFLGAGGALTLRHAIGFSAAERDGLASLFGHPAVLDRAAASTVALTLPSDDLPEEQAQSVLAAAGANAAQLVPLVSQGRGVGVILLAAPRQDQWSSDAGAFARAMGNQLVQSLALADSFTRIAASEERYRSLVENAHDAISVLTPEGVIREVNASWERAFGLSRTDAVGRSIGDFAVDGQEGQDLEGFLDLTRESGQSGPRTLLRADGTELVMEFSVTAIEVGGERLVLSIGRDVTEQTRSQAQLMLADRMVSIGLLAAGVAHEINNPLTAVAGNLELAALDLERAREEAPGVAALEQLVAEVNDAREAADRVRDIVRDLRVFSHPREDRSVPVDVHSVLDSSLRIARSEIRHRSTVIRDYGEIPYVLADESRLGQVFLNLLVNAAQALPDGHAEEHEIRLRTRTSEGSAVIEIADTGSGMPPAVLARLFTPFFTTKPLGVGTGLGLAICRRIVTALGGDITVASEVGRGTTVRVTLPAARLDGEPEGPAPDDAPPSRTGRILVVDDERKVGELLQRMFAPEHAVEICTSAREALGRITAGDRFDLVLCDLMMPEMTGMELHAELRRLSPRDADAMVFLTGGAFTPQARAFLEQVANERLEKPFDAARLRRLLAERLDRG